MAFFGLYVFKGGLKDIREAKEHSTGFPIARLALIILGGFIVLVMIIIVAIGVAERNSPKTIPTEHS